MEPMTDKKEVNVSRIHCKFSENNYYSEICRHNGDCKVAYKLWHLKSKDFLNRNVCLCVTNE